MLVSGDTREPLPADWTGTAAQLALALIQALPKYALSPDPVPSERLIRFYVTSGVLLKPQREGREALFGQRQALQFLAARALLEDGWPLAKVATYLQELVDSDLLALLPEREVVAPAGGAVPNRAQQLIARFRRGAGEVPAPAPQAPGGAPVPQAPAASQAPQMQQKAAAIPLPAPGEEALRERQSVRAALREEMAKEAVEEAAPVLLADEVAAEVAEATPTEREIRVHITLTPWCEVALSQDVLDRLTPDDVESATTLFRTVLESELSE